MFFISILFSIKENHLQKEDWKYSVVQKFKCKQHTMYLIYALIRSRSLAHSLALFLSLSLFQSFSLSNIIYFSPTVVYLLYIHFASQIIKLWCSSLLRTTNKATFEVVLSFVVKYFSVAYSTCSCTLHIKVFV